MRLKLSFSASVTAVKALTRDLAQNLGQSRGVRAETVAAVLSNATALVASIENTDPGNVDLEYARIGMLLALSETYRSVALERSECGVGLNQVVAAEFNSVAEFQNLSAQGWIFRPGSGFGAATCLARGNKNVRFWL